MEVIPALDLRGGQVVRLTQGDYARETVYESDPARAAGRFLEGGAARLHVVDLEGARDGVTQAGDAIRSIVDAAGPVPVQLGGGIRSLERVEALLELGIDRVILGTAALADPDLLAAASERFPGRVVLGLDARDGRVATHGWTEIAEVTVLDVLAQFEGLPLGGIVYTDISRDGMLEGPNVEATQALASKTRLPVIASGGVSSVEDLVALARTRVISGTIVGRALYTGDVDLETALREVAAC
ncbi:MAG: 1-(5-phosphoribosyl)-5-[(5-phosphoribosylamino)methylideneamino]imidazole-4-carboxamide isomerase [Deltaproteobacteria bacterium]|nr:1-(5-phosphoribosyl)-5-[(5-phosphoribosylamino)methylideneamino]imidazole-4-carboxamide isomerase [Deltaproteobacteria bacterium]